ncbi:MAG: alpha-amylase family protein [Haliangiales bacterium]
MYTARMSLSSPPAPAALTDSLAPADAEVFQARLEALWPDIERPLSLLYGQRDDYGACLADLVAVAARGFGARPKRLRLRDVARSAAPDWFQDPSMVGYVCYADRFAQTLSGVTDKLDYLSELGVRYLHLMPLLAPRPGPNDGGYAVVDYARVDERLGTMNDLAGLAAALHERDMSLCIDLVCNHTAREHPWAQAARAGDEAYRDYYLTFPDRSLPDAYERTLREIFPDFAPGNFTYDEAMERWVWTTFNDYQWDLNYKNPKLLGEMLAAMLHLANQGVDVLRMDAVAFLWKRLGTDCENQPEAHAILQALAALCRVAAPALLLKAEAIVAPPMLLPYFGTGAAAGRECALAYHNVLMVMLWSSLAERKAVLATHALQQIAATPARTAWVTYVRCHDDIGWAVTDEDAGAVGLSGFAHRSFLSDFYAGEFPGSFARGAVFQHNPRTGDRRISGSCASLAGLEAARREAAAEPNPEATAELTPEPKPEATAELKIDLAIRRILCLYRVIFAFRGIPLIYMGDELGLENDYSYRDQPDHAGDNRWLHRPPMDWDQAALRHQPGTIEGRLFDAMTDLARARAAIPALHAEAACEPVWTHNDHVLGVLRHGPRGRILVLANMSEQPQLVTHERVSALGFASARWDHLADRPVPDGQAVYLSGYEVVWLGGPE